MSTTQDVFGKVERDADRLNYKLGMNLDADDLQTEQAYHRRQLARALAYAQGYGTVSGMKVAVEIDDEEEPEKLQVAPGLAIDPIGRLVELPQAVCIRLNRWYQQQNPDTLTQAFHTFRGVTGVMADLFIRFVVCEKGKTPAFASGPFDALDAITAARLNDGYELELILRTEEIENDSSLMPAHPTLANLDPADFASQREAVAAAIFSSWREGSANWNRNGPPRLPEHQLGQNPTDIFLARIMIPATEAANPEDAPERGEDEVEIFQLERPFAISPTILAWLTGYPFQA